MVSCYGTITLDTKVSFRTAKWKEKVLKPGLMEIDMKACGLTIYNTVLDYSIMLKQIKRLQKNGEKEKDGLGIKPLSWLQEVCLVQKKLG